MEIRIKEAMNDNIIKQAAKMYDVDFKDIKHLGGFENFIYEYKKDNNEYVIRFVHSIHRSYEFVYAELEFIDYLAKNGANVSTVIPANNGDLVFKINTKDDEYFTVCVFTKAKGTYVRESAEKEDFILGFGEAVARLHTLTKGYKPVHKRYHWHEEDYLEIGARHMPKDKLYLIEIGKKLIEKLKKYEIDNDSYGLIHTDLHFGNMYYDGETLTFFDFDDASYKHFISDIAIILFYSYGIRGLKQSEIQEKSTRFLKIFLQGYERINKINPIWFERLNDFFMLRQITLIMVIYGAGEEMINSGWGKNFLDTYIDKVTKNTPYMDVDKMMSEIWNS